MQPTWMNLDTNNAMLDTIGELHRKAKENADALMAGMDDQSRLAFIKNDYLPIVEGLAKALEHITY